MMRRWLPVAVGAGIVVWVVALALLAVTAEGSQRLGQLQPWILLVNIAGVVVLLALIGGRLTEFVRDWRRRVPGSRLRGRTMLMFGGLSIAPLLLVFTFSVLFLTRGIDSWFHAEVREGLSDALGLSRAALDLRSYLNALSALRTTCRYMGGAVQRADEHMRLAGADEMIVAVRWPAGL
jgi:nitrogen fixation/metabolism regulation signal transduction histidine kinase